MVMAPVAVPARAWPLDQSTVHNPSQAVREPHSINMGPYYYGCRTAAAGQLSLAIQGAVRVGVACAIAHTP